MKVSARRTEMLIHADHAARNLRAAIGSLDVARDIARPLTEYTQLFDLHARARDLLKAINDVLHANGRSVR